MNGLSPVDRERLDGIPLSVVGWHPGRCCADAWQLLLRRLDGFPDLGSRLAAVPVVVPWGPVRWPVHWCEVAGPGEPVGDCGVHADLAAALLTAAGIDHERGRAAIACSPWAAAHWRTSWRRAGCDPRWIGTDVVHHEVIRVGRRWWAPTDACWFDGAGAALLSGRVVAVRTDTGPWHPAAR